YVAIGCVGGTDIRSRGHGRGVDGCFVHRLEVQVPRGIVLHLKAQSRDRRIVLGRLRLMQLRSQLASVPQFAGLRVPSTPSVMEVNIGICSATTPDSADAIASAIQRANEPSAHSTKVRVFTPLSMYT